MRQSGTISGNFLHADHHHCFLLPLFNVQNRAFWKPLAEIFLKYLLTSVNSLRSPPRNMPASPPVSGSILPAAPLCKNRGKVETLSENYLTGCFSSWAMLLRGRSHRGISPLFLPSPLNGKNRRFWRHLRLIFENFLAQLTVEGLKSVLFHKKKTLAVLPRRMIGQKCRIHKCCY